MLKISNIIGIKIPLRFGGAGVQEGFGTAGKINNVLNLVG